MQSVGMLDLRHDTLVFPIWQSTVTRYRNGCFSVLFSVGLGFAEKFGCCLQSAGIIIFLSSVSLCFPSSYNRSVYPHRGQLLSSRSQLSPISWVLEIGQFTVKNTGILKPLTGSLRENTGIYFHHGYTKLKSRVQKSTANKLNMVPRFFY